MLRLLLLLPLAGALLVGVLPRKRYQLLWGVAFATALATLMLAWSQIANFDIGSAEIQFFETHTWNPRLGSAFSLGLDGLSFALVLLATLLIVVALLAFRVPDRGAKLYYVLLLMLETAALGVFMARDWSLFYVFWEMTLIPLFFLIERLGGAQRQRAALNFVLYTMGGSVFMLVALLLLYDAAPGHSFDMLSMATGGMSLATDKQVLIFLGLFIGFAVKMGVFPLHGWMPLVYAEAPAAVTLISSGILLKMGAYGILRAVTTLPGAAIALQQSLTILAFVSLLYGALLAWKSRNLVVMAAYASISHMAVVLLGTATLNATGITGAALQMLGHGLAAGLLFLLLGLLAERLGSRELVDFEGLLQRAPRFAGLLILALVGSIGLPGTIGFISELQVMVGGYARWGGAIALLSVAVLIGAAYGLRVTNVILSPNTKPDLAPIADLGRAEAVAAGILLTGMIGLGFFPMPLLELLGQTAAAMGRLFGAVA
jgi:NADH-quinone oxidoreductase subunit M